MFGFCNVGVGVCECFDNCVGVIIIIKIIIILHKVVISLQIYCTKPHKRTDFPDESQHSPDRNCPVKSTTLHVRGVHILWNKPNFGTRPIDFRFM